MAEVWRADDLVLDTPVALKLIHSASPEARGRILNEVRLARQITGDIRNATSGVAVSRTCHSMI
jgi:hypothetical protein